MDEMARLRHLLEHWMEHNVEHVNTYLKWAEMADAHGKRELAETLRRIASETERLEGLFREAREKLG
jgi:rubrerythrin